MTLPNSLGICFSFFKFWSILSARVSVFVYMRAHPVFSPAFGSPQPLWFSGHGFKAFWEGLITHTQEVRGGRGPSRVPCKKTGIPDKDSLVLHITDTSLYTLTVVGNCFRKVSSLLILRSFGPPRKGCFGFWCWCEGFKVWILWSEEWRSCVRSRFGGLFV